MHAPLAQLGATIARAGGYSAWVAVAAKVTLTRTLTLTLTRTLTLTLTLTLTSPLSAGSRQTVEKRGWSVEEDEQLMQLVSDHGPQSW